MLKIKKYEDQIEKISGGEFNTGHFMGLCMGSAVSALLVAKLFYNRGVLPPPIALLTAGTVGAFLTAYAINAIETE